ncbi:MAG TPA: DUF5916 domain-containing protein, partial [Vicinamibacterales bacterium]|nr:DUF5916 domain-containing protein [Vicinamibacterales bacterium]
MPSLAAGRVDPPATQRHADEAAGPEAAPAPAPSPIPVPAGRVEPIGPDGRVEVYRIDPETFQAFATRLPKGQAPKIDGHLDDPVWKLAKPAGHFIQREPDFGAEASERTEVRILYDDRTLYFGVWAYDDDPAGIIASEMKRDSGLSRGDAIKIDLDTFHDHRNAFYFSTNPLGARKDANSVENGRTINYDWDAVWQSKTSRDGKGWYAEIAVPLSQLRFNGHPGNSVWGINLCRIIIRKHEEDYWVPFPREWGATGFANLTYAGVLMGLKNLPDRHRLEFMPFIAPGVSRDYDAGTPTTVDHKYGFDLRYGLTSNLTATATYKTDFAQVEADQEVVNLSRFSLYFPEKRQFFTESAGIFDYGRTGVGFSGGENDGGPGLLALFYSRQIGLYDGQQVPILGGGKMTGRVGQYDMGLLNIETDPAAVQNADGSTTQLGRANYTAFRVKRNILAKSSIGAIFLNRQGGDAGSGYNRAIGFDSGLAFGNNVTIAAMGAKTFSPGAGGKDFAGALDLAYKSDRVNYGGTYVDIGQRFNAEMGFIPRVDIRHSRLSAGWTPRPRRWRSVRQLTFGGQLDYYEDHHGRPESRTDLVTVAAARQDGSNLTLTAQRDFDYVPVDFVIGPATIPIGGYRFDTVTAAYSTNSSKRVYASGSAAAGTFYGGRKQTYQVGLNFLPFGTLLIENIYTRNQLSLPGTRPFATNVLSSRVSYSFSPNLFVKTFVQYNDDRRLATLNLLFWYIYRPGSNLYVVYNQGWDTNLPGPY